MNCERCDAQGSKFDVHCVSCGAYFEPKPFEDQLAILGLSPEDIKVGTTGPGGSSGYTLRTMAAGLGNGLLEGTSYFIASLFRPIGKG